MEYILCVDNSGSTSGCTPYWDKVQSLYETYKPKRMIYWNSEACDVKEFHRLSTGCTQPQKFLPLLQTEQTAYNLIVTTDGEICDYDIDACRELPQLSFVNSISIYYIGHESSMNIGLNVIFAQLQCDTSYNINGTDYRIFHDNAKFDTLTYEEFMSPNLIVSLTVQIENIIASFPSPEREKRIAELRSQLNKLCSKFEIDKLPKTDKLEELYKANDTKKFLDHLREDQNQVQDVNSRKCTILNIFDRKHSLNISRILGASAVSQPTDIEVTTEINDDWQQFEDFITLNTFNLPCLLFKKCQTPIITDDLLLKHPFKLLSRPELIDKIMKSIEPNLIDYTTYCKLSEKIPLISPYTRDPCSGVFILETKDSKSIRNNCRTISTLFGSGYKVPGNLNLWNLIMLYLIHKYKFPSDDQIRDIILQQIKDFCKHFSAKITLSHQCQVIRKAPIEICLWFSVFASSKECPNSALNILRSPFGWELLTFYGDVFGTVDPELIQRTKKWTIWNYLLKNRDRPDLKLEVKAQYQNYSIHMDKIVLLVGECSTPFKSELNMLDADSVQTLFTNLTNVSSKFENIDNFQIKPVEIALDDNVSIESIHHVKINMKTCWPLVICPITKLHWRDCIGNYDVKSGSLIRIFNKYCHKYEKYPETYMDLALYYNRSIENRPLTTANIECLKYIMDVIFKEVMATYECKEYLGIYVNHTDEAVRLEKE